MKVHKAALVQCRAPVLSLRAPTPFELCPCSAERRGRWSTSESSRRGSTSCWEPQPTLRAWWSWWRTMRSTRCTGRWSCATPWRRSCWSATARYWDTGIDWDAGLGSASATGSLREVKQVTFCETEMAILTSFTKVWRTASSLITDQLLPSPWFDQRNPTVYWGSLPY